MKKFLLLAVFGLQLTLAPAQNVSTLAGSGSIGSTDATGIFASFNNPGGIAVDASGNVFVADQSNYKIRKITSAGVVTTFAGSGVAASVDGTGTAASFNVPSGIAIDATGNLYVTDYYGHTIRMITPAGVVTTFAGSGVAGNADGTGTAASFNYPVDIAIDPAGNLFVSDLNNYTIRKITPAGVVTTFAGSGLIGSADGIGTAASFYQPLGICCDLNGNVYVADYSNNKIRKITPGGVVTTVAGSGVNGGADGPAASATFSYPYDVAVDASGNLFVTQSSGMIRQISVSNNMVSTYTGFFNITGFANGAASTATFNSPQGIAIDATGNLFISEQGNNAIRQVSSSGSGMQNENYNLNFSFFPNPTASTLTIQTAEAIESVTIYNVTGAVVQTETKNVFSVAELPAGVYLLRVQTANGISTSRFIKE